MAQSLVCVMVEASLQLEEDLCASSGKFSRVLLGCTCPQQPRYIEGMRDINTLAKIHRCSALFSSTMSKVVLLLGQSNDHM